VLTTITTLPKNKSTIGCKCIYKVNYNVNGTIVRYKVRLVIKGILNMLRNLFKWRLKARGLYENSPWLKS